MNYKKLSPDELLKIHRQLNDEIFSSLAEVNSEQDGLRKIDFYFLSPELSQLQNLASVLRDEFRYEVEVYVEETDDGEEFTLQGSCVDVPVKPDVIHEWVEEMIRFGSGFLCSFGGWGFEHS